MATFINTSRGLLNLDHVVLIKQGVAKEAGENYVQLADGRILSGIILDPIPGLPAPVTTAPVTTAPVTTAPVTTAPVTKPQDQDQDEEPETATGRWRPIDENTPKHGNYARVWVQEGLLYCPDNGEATHWMPLEPPRDEPKTAVGRWGG